MALVSVIVCSIDPAKFARVSANYGLRLAGIEHEIVAIHDARSLAEGYNRGVRRARGEVLVFSHDDVEHLRDDFAGVLLDSLDNADVVGAVGTTRCVDAFWAAAGHPYLHGACVFPMPAEAANLVIYGIEAPFVGGIQALDGMFFAARREVLERVVFDEDTFDGFHGYDVDFTFSAQKAGFSVAINNRFLVMHRSGGGFDDAYLVYRDRFLRKHFGSARVPLPERPVFIQSPFPSAEAVAAAWDIPTIIELTRQLRQRLESAARAT